MPEPTFKDVKEMPEGEWRTHLMGRLDTGFEHVKEIAETVKKHDEVLGGLRVRIKVVWGLLIAAATAAIGSFFGSKP